MARETGARILITAGSAEKIRRCIELGAEAGCNYKEQDFVEWVHGLTQGQGVDVIEDFIGAAYWDKNLRSLKIGGRLVLVGLMGGVKVETNLGLILSRRLQIFGSVLRSRTLEDKIAITQRFRQNWLPLLIAGKNQSRLLIRFFPWPKPPRPTATWKTTATSARSCWRSRRRSGILAHKPRLFLSPGAGCSHSLCQARTWVWKDLGA